MAIEIFLKNEHCEWIDVVAPTAEDLKFIHERYSINHLLLEDTIDANHLPKFEKVDEVMFYLMRENTELERTNLSSISDVSTKLGVFIFEKTIITIHRMKNRSIQETKVEAEKKAEAIRKEDIALLLGMKVLKSYDSEGSHLLDVLDKMEDQIFLKNAHDSNQIRRLYKIKRKAGLNTRILNISTSWVEKFSLLNLIDSEIVDLKDKHKDVIADFDHLNSQVTNLISMFIALSDQKANQVMKLLAIFSVYFLPITFIAGVYGMNFDFMPELHLKHGYFYVLGLMLTIEITIFIYMRRKKW
ncbi:CorA family divalent cation transporter [Halpernia frigidisoli]|uniref:Magnesium transporter n=1 Tax=Halpernia frigidisoli TaxID=1125876 RepID=A0A1I3FAX7_9FLAO|nr:CorA family divalent cation transporter [Halpernia frigidisoli]SFI08375.1 magnesium transporter [Halpernia frigidisoli]